MGLLTDVCHTQVVVTGASGRTGLLTIKKLLEDKEKYPSVVGTVRSKAGSGKALTAAGLPEDAILEFDLTAAVAAAEEGKANNSLDNLEAALKDAQVLIIATSGVPQIKYASLLGKCSSTHAQLVMSVGSSCMHSSHMSQAIMMGIMLNLP